MGAVRDFMERHFLHFNSRELVAAAQAWEAHLAAGGRMMLSMAGAMSTARIGRILARAIRQGKVHAVSCTGANLEEDVFNLLAANDYEIVPDWRALSAADEKALFERGMNRVTDTCIPETVMRELENRLLALWGKAGESKSPRMPYEFIYQALGDPSLAAHFQIPSEESWVLACRDMKIPIFTPGWEDSTTGNVMAAAVFKGELPAHGVVRSGIEQLDALMHWYLESCNRDADGPSVGFFQIGGGIAGDFAICAVPCLIQDVRLERVPYWDYFCQISDAVTSYGGYSGAVPNEKITWGKLDVDTPKFMIQSDATIVAPLVLAYLLGD